MPDDKMGADGNPSKAEAGWPPAVIAGAFQTGVLGVRSLKRRGVHAICFDSNPQYAGFRSVYGPARLCPNPDRAPDEWLRFMLDLAATMPGRPALISSSDQFVTAIAAHEDALRDHYILSPGMPPAGTAGRQADAVRPCREARHADAAHRLRHVRGPGCSLREGRALSVPAEADALPPVAALPERPPALVSEGGDRAGPRAAGRTVSSGRRGEPAA